MKVTKKITRPVVERAGAKFTFKRAGGTLTESAHKRLKESSLRNYDFAGLNAELRATLPADYIDNHNSDLYVKKTPESTEILKKYGILGHHFCTTFSSQTPPLGIWYDIAFAYVPNADDMGTYFDDIQPETESLKEGRGDGFVKRYKGCAIHKQGDTYVACNEKGLNIGQSQHMDGVKEIIDKHIGEKSNSDLKESNDEILVFKKDVQSAEDVDDIQYAIQRLSDGVAEDALQSAFNEADEKDIDAVKNAVISALDVYLEDNEWLGEAVDEDDEKPYTYNQVLAELKSITKNFTDKKGMVKCGYKEEAEHAEKILSKHYESAELDKVGSWFQIDYAGPLKGKKKSVKESEEYVTRYKVEFYTDSDDENRSSVEVFADTKEEAVKKAKEKEGSNITVTATIPEKVPARYKSWE